ncbi:MAG TPA: PilZ domain-containing protein [Geothrix sp.]|nr:PilZ domain-containing protein [Geothrix sp.]
MDRSSDQRSNPREPMHQVVRFERSAGDLEPEHRGVAHGVGCDISEQGLSLLTDCFLGQGEVLKLHIPLAEDRASVPVFSDVRWVRRESEGFRVGLQFLA